MKKAKNSKEHSQARPQQKRSQVLYDSILEGATLSFDKLGFEKTTTNKIAEVVGISIGSFYRYFPDKKVLFKTLTERFTEGNRNEFVGWLQDLNGSPLEVTVSTMMNRSIDQFLGEKIFFKLILIKMFEVDCSAEIFDARRKLADSVADVLIKNYPEMGLASHEVALKEDLCSGFHAYMSALHAAAFKTAGPEEVQRLKENMSNLFLSIIKKYNSPNITKA